MRHGVAEGMCQTVQKVVGGRQEGGSGGQEGPGEAPGRTARPLLRPYSGRILLAN